jgi:hypothetical protein
MAQALVVVCDVCGRPAVDTVTLRVGSRGYQKDVCQAHLDEMVKGARAPRRGRPRTKPATAAGHPAAKRKAAAKRKTSAKRATGRKAS